MNWERGFKRAWYFLLGIIWVFCLFLASLNSAFMVGQAIVYLLLFTLAWLLVGGALVWVARGFRQDQPKPTSSR